MVAPFDFLLDHYITLSPHDFVHPIMTELETQGPALRD